jgi:hypothetical protein
MPIDPFAEPVGDEDPYAAQEQALANDLSGNGVSVSSIVTTPEIIGPGQDPEVAQDFENGKSQQPSDSAIDKAPAATDFGASIQRFDDGSSIQTFDDGSTLVTDSSGKITSTPATVDPAVNPSADPASLFTKPGSAGTFTGDIFKLGSAGQAAAASLLQAQVNNARQQQTYADQQRQVNSQDWRVRLSLAPQSNYLYNVQPAGSAGILEPLRGTNGVIFPYTPAISTAYRANYTPYDLTHSNYRGYWYQNSFVDNVNITATFTAQNTQEANYLLAVIHFFRSATKMFYGQDAERGSPPPIVYLSGLGEYQFNKHSCLISNFNYTLPADVDYIRAGSTNNLQLNQDLARPKTGVSTNSNFGSLQRLATAILGNGQKPSVGAISYIPRPSNLQNNNPTYVPTKIEIQLTLMPVQSRQQVSSQFSVKNFANGNLLRGGFW